MALPPCLLVAHPWATMMVQQQAVHAQLATAAQAWCKCRQLMHRLPMLQHRSSFAGTKCTTILHMPLPHKQHKIITEEKLQEKGEAVISLHITVVSQVRLGVFPSTSCVIHYLLFQFIIICYSVLLSC